MQLTRRHDWNPFREMDELTNRLGRLFGLSRAEGNGDQQQSLTLSDWAPACDITENDKEYRILAELPKVKKGDVHVSVDNGILAIRGERKEEKEEKDVKYHRREVAYGSFVRSFTLPEDADESKVQANFRDGALTVTVGKSATKQPKAKEIAVN